MKSKAKPAKGSARVKKFDVGGTVGALAGLGTLAYLMSRKKKAAEGEYKPQGKFPMEQAHEIATESKAAREKTDERKAKNESSYAPENKFDVAKQTGFTGDGKDDKTKPTTGPKRPRPAVKTSALKTSDTAKFTSLHSKLTTRDKPSVADQQAAVSTVRKLAEKKTGADQTKPKSDSPSKSDSPLQNRFPTAEQSKQATESVGRGWREQNPGLTKAAENVKKFFSSGDTSASKGKTPLETGDDLIRQRKEAQRKKLEAQQNKLEADSQKGSREKKPNPFLKAGGTVKKYAAGGLAENVPAKGSSKPNAPMGEKIPGGAPKKSAPSIPEWLKNERENQERDRRVKREREAYDKYDKTRLKDQGSFKKGGSVSSASKRADGIAMRGKTKGKIY